MAIKMKKLLLALSCCWYLNTAQAGILMYWGPRDLNGMAETEFNAAKSWSMEKIIQTLSTTTDWPQLYLAEVSAQKYKKNKQFIHELISLTSDNRVIELHNTSRLIIWPRITSGEIFFEGPGAQLNDDIFHVAGRANWFLHELVDKNFGYVSVNATPEELRSLQQKWKRWYLGKKVPEYINPYDSKNHGLSDINSPEALEAIIYSLKPSEQKDQYMYRCLSRVYKLKEMPTEKYHPAKLCNPDNYSYRYLAKLTEIKQPQSLSWQEWRQWWATNKNHLFWNKETAKFEIR